MSNKYSDKFTVTRLTVLKGETNLKAFASVKLGEVLTIHDCRIVQQPGQKPFVSLPQRKDEATGKYHYIVFAEDREFSEALQEKVLAEYETKMLLEAVPAGMVTQLEDIPF